MNSYPSRDKAKTALKKLERETPTPEEFDTILRELLTFDNDRSLAILGASLVESALQRRLVLQFRNLNGKEFDDLFRNIHGPLSDLSSKAMLTYALDKCAKEVRGEIDIIRRIRNVFVHVLKPLTFKTKEIVHICHHLHMGRPDPEPTVWLPKFQFVASVMAVVKIMLPSIREIETDVMIKALKAHGS